MPRVLDVSDMSAQEKGAWVYAAVAVVVPIGYFAYLSATGAAYVVPLLVATGVAMVANMVLTIVAVAVRPEDVAPKDERDRQIDRAANSVGFSVMSLATLVPLVLAILEVEHFWIAQSLYLAFVLAALSTAITRIVGYRRGV
jgi:hypothetical protein